MARFGHSAGKITNFCALVKTLLKVVIRMLNVGGREQSQQDWLKIMLICHCERVNDRRIRQVVENGARTVGQVGKSCGAGTCCGGCVKAIAEIVEEVEGRSSPAPRDPASRLPASPAPAQVRRPLPVAAE